MRFDNAYSLRFQLQGVAVAGLLPMIHSVLGCASPTPYVTADQTYPQVLHDTSNMHEAKLESCHVNAGW